MKRVIWMGLIIFPLLQNYYVAHATLPLPFEDLLPRAETVLIGRITKHSEKGVTFEIDETIRGWSDPPTLTLRFDSPLDEGLPANGSSFLVISQGDDHLGEPRDVITLGQPMFGQAEYCGWMAFPIRGRGAARYLPLLYTYVGRRRTGTGARLTLDMARRLTQQVAYKGRP